MRIAGTLPGGGDGVSRSEFEALDRFVGWAGSTGLVEGGVMSIGSGPALLDIAAGTGVIYDYKTDPLAPTKTLVSWGAFSDVTLPNLGTSIASTIGIDVLAAVQQLGTPSTPVFRRERVVLGVVTHTDFANITGIANNPILAFGKEGTAYDALVETGEQNISGNVYSANGANLLLDKSAGVVFSLGSNARTNVNDPNFTSVIAQTGISAYLRTYRDGVGGYVTDVTAAIDPSVFDDGSGTLAAVPPNRWTITEIRLVGELGITVTIPGQEVYATSEDAILAIPIPTDVNPSVSQVPVRLWLVTHDGTTDLSDPADAFFVPAALNGFSGS